MVSVHSTRYIAHFTSFNIHPTTSYRTTLPPSLLQLHIRRRSAPMASSTEDPSAGNSESTSDVLVQYVVLRRDLIDTWPLGSVVTQGCHASVAAIWSHKDDPHTIDYCSPNNLDSMHKVTLEVKGETQLKNLSDKLTSNNIAHKLWIEQPENYPTCLASKPYPKSVVSSFFKKLKLLSQVFDNCFDGDGRPPYLGFDNCFESVALIPYNKFKTHGPFIFFSISSFCLFLPIINKKFHNLRLRSSICTSIQVNFYQCYALMMLIIKYGFNFNPHFVNLYHDFDLHIPLYHLFLFDFLLSDLFHITLIWYFFFLHVTDVPSVLQKQTISWTLQNDTFTNQVCCKFGFFVQPTTHMHTWVVDSSASLMSTNQVGNYQMRTSQFKPTSSSRQISVPSAASSNQHPTGTFYVNISNPDIYWFKQPIQSRLILTQLKISGI
ncbi:hypothetical protein QVD17_04140 [Tagetes erecta]|uniref:peptidyl-tRNA hydrolase n=1 Tax=Tagetes erecta TaxID=13708 RepID=A0AAD8P9I2_TARER|nr:hypothetical protein QVD17_04140 [Tagetes erecta]